MAIDFKGAHFPPDIILMGVRWYVAYPLSTRHVEELMLERGVHVDHSTINRWVVTYSPQLEEAFHRRKRPVWISWRMDETYIKVKGEWKYLYRAVDKYGQTIDCLLTEQRDTEAALKFLKQAIRRNGLPETITIDGSDANEAAIKSYNETHGTTIIIRQVKYLNNIVEQDPRGVKRITRPMLGFKAFDTDERPLGCLERFEPQHGPCHPLHAAMILFDDVVQIFDLADGDRGPMLCIVALDGRCIGRAPVDGDF